MLKLLRNESHKKKIFWGMALLIIPSFVIFGVVAEQEGDDIGDSAGRIEKHQISTGDFVRHYQAARRELYLLRGIDPRSAGEIDFEKITWDRILLLDYAKKSGIKASNADVLDWIARQEVFSPGGTFSEPLYKIYVERQLRLTPREFEEEIRGFLTVQKAILKIAPEKTVSDDEAKRIYLERFSPRDLKYVVVRAPETAAATVTDEEVKKLYDTIARVLEVPESRKARYISIEKGSSQDKPETKDAIAKDLAAGVSQGAASHETGLLKRADPFPGAEASDPVMQSLFGLAAGERTGWVDAGKSWILAELVEIVPTRPMTYEEAEKDLREKMTASEKGRASFDLALNARKKMEEQGFAKAAEEEKLEVLEAKGFKRSDALPKAGALLDFESLAPLKAGQISPPMLAAEGHVIAEVVSVQETLGDDWEKEKEALRTELAEQGREEAYRAEMAKLWSKLEPNQSTMAALFPDKYEEVPVPPSAPEIEAAETPAP